ncbi:MAG: UbiX family flavin prenyltransferase [Fibrobacter sp.]|uniref:UbiX family flavin prenyltransferase n=1 Tax=Fibrobacter sp. TaxID=35828 RepID=UPI0025C44DC4|nr:UbiX family flavin prenyltransferase [Fibrobacter sp.]MBS7271096.1 UbiX family flavin prenyltransferase [Fibrobacter sp.]
MSRYILGVTGASGAIYAVRTAMHLKRLGHHVTALVTPPGKGVLRYEEQNCLFDYVDALPDMDDFFAECASGSADYAGMAVVPCSMGTLGRIAAGTSDNLLIRAADVCLKERRPLIVVPRETPYNMIHLDNMMRLTRMGVVVIPASPHFYDRPKTIEEAVDTVVAKILMHLKAFPEENDVVKPWKGTSMLKVLSKSTGKAKGKKK